MSARVPSRTCFRSASSRLLTPLRTQRIPLQGGGSIGREPTRAARSRSTPLESSFDSPRTSSDSCTELGQLSVCQFVLRDEAVMSLFSNLDVLAFNGQFHHRNGTVRQELHANRSRDKRRKLRLTEANVLPHLNDAQAVGAPLGLN